MRMPRVTLSVLALTAANLVPLVGVFFLAWDAAVIVLLYWTENVIIGFYTVAKIAIAKVEPPVFNLGKLFAIPFFCIHFGGFCTVHGLFLLVFFRLGSGLEPEFPDVSWPGPLAFVQLPISLASALWKDRPYGMEWPLIGLSASHGISFVQNYLVRKEYLSLGVSNLMSEPYRRIVLLHVAILAGGVPVMILGSPIPLLSVLVFLKIWLDIRLHIKSHAIDSSIKAKETRGGQS
jgi:hypothetical protein